MGKKHKLYQSPTVKIQPLPKAFTNTVTMTNLQEQKERFLRQGKTPVFLVEGDTAPVEELAAKSSGKIRFDLLGEAEYILQRVKKEFSTGEEYLEHTYGPRIDQEEANEILLDYIRENSLQESLTVYWSNEMTCSARMAWKGYSFKCNRPESRRYSLWLNGTDENPYLRRFGLRCLLDHEIGTHFYRSYNDGFQPWFYDRRKFGLRGAGSFESLCTEEGLAAINTTLRAKEKFLWLSSLVYYTACKATEMTFKQLFDHLGQFVHNPEQRWKHVMRVKRGLIDPNDLGGYGKDQCYFEGAVAILRNIDDINFNLLMSGKICFDEVSRVKRLARLGSVCLPAIMQDMEAYRKELKNIAVFNGLHLEHPKYGPSPPYLQRLKERQLGIHKRKKVRKTRKLRRSSSTKPSASSNSSTSSSSGSESLETCKALSQYACPNSEQFSFPDTQRSSASSYSKPQKSTTDQVELEGMQTENKFNVLPEKKIWHMQYLNASTAIKEMSYIPCVRFSRPISPRLQLLNYLDQLQSARNADQTKATAQTQCARYSNVSTQGLSSSSNTDIEQQLPLSFPECTADLKTSGRARKRPKSSPNTRANVKLGPLPFIDSDKLNLTPRPEEALFTSSGKVGGGVSTSTVVCEMASSVCRSTASIYQKL